MKKKEKVNIPANKFPRTICEVASTANKIPLNCQSILQANAQARLIEKDMERNPTGPMLPTGPSFNVWETRHQYRKQFVLPGRANRDKSTNNIY